MNYHVLQGNACKLPSYIKEKGNFTLLLIDLPRGMDTKRDKNDTPLTRAELTQVLKGFMEITSAKE